MAQGLSIPCAERGASYRVLNGGIGVMEVAVKPHDLLSWRALSGKGQLMIDIGAGYRPAPTPGTFSTHAGLVSVRIKVEGAASAATAVSCVAGSAKDAPNGVSAEVAADSQTFATSTGVGLNAQNRFKSGGTIVSRNLMFMSTSGMVSDRFLPPEWNAWATLEGRSYSGVLDGHSFDLVGGVDRLVSPDLLVGVLGGFGRTFVTDAGTPETVTSPMLGAYFGRNWNDALILDGFVAFAAPRYGISGATFSSRRLSGGMTLTGRVRHDTVTVEPFLFARAYHEWQPTYTTGLGAVVAANEAINVSASLGVRVSMTGTAEAPNRLVPYVSAAADMRRASSTLGGVDLVSAPRIGLGLRGDIAGGQMSLDFDFGKTRSDTYDRGMKFGYEMKF
ncbi:MAG: autotransporter outer membrane beta-barrel domain-containing protein [Rhodobacteraceae bacterium]|nr:autotransporter outer membrane beta-barrel domain-containing protein [Paracoccaceae bacterium]